MMKSLLCLTLALLLAGPLRAGTLELGANFNEFLDVARVDALDAGHTRWIRGFLPATEFVDHGRSLANDPLLGAFRTAAQSGRKVAITLKWDFKGSGTRVPVPGSPREETLFAWAIEAARATHPDLLLLVNELFIDTPPEDLQPQAEGTIPMVVFLQRLAARVHAAGLKTPAGEPLRLGCGGFTLTNTEATRKHPATLALLPWLATAPELDCVNFHLHQATMKDFESGLDFMRGRVPDRPFVITEFSLVMAYRRHLSDLVGATTAGRAFAAEYRRDPRQTVLDYLNACLKQRVTEAEWHAFLRSQPWFDPQFLSKACDLMERHGVTLATYAYLQSSSGGLRKLAPEGTPWRLNPVFVDLFAISPDPSRPATNLGFWKTYLEYQK